MLPRIPYKMRKNKNQVTAFRGINFSNMTHEGDIADSQNISARAYPYLTTRKARELVESYGNTTAMTMFMGRIVTVAEGVLYWGDKSAGKLMPGQKQFALVNTKLCIMPDKKYLSIQDGEPILNDMGASIELHNVQFTKNALKIGTGVATIASGFGCTVDGDSLSIAENTRRELKCDKIGVVGSSVYLCALEGEKMTLKLRCESDGSFILDANMNMLTAKQGDIIFLSDGTIYKALENGKFRIKVARRSLRVWQTKYPSTTVYDPILAEHKAVDVYMSTEVEHVKVGGQIKFVTDTFDKTLTVRGVSENEIVADVGVDDGLYGGTVTVVGWDGETAFADLKSFENKEVVIKSKSIGYKPVTVVNVTDTEVTFSEPIGINAELLENISLCVETDGELADLDKIFKVGDGVTIAGVGKNSELTFIISEILKEDGATSLTAKKDVFEEGVVSDITVERRIPKMDFICESENRLWGCSNDDSTIYASALGDPTNFFVYDGVSTDSYAVAVGSEGDFTACCRYGSDVLFWKEAKLHKVIGSYPAEYVMYSYDIEGVQKGCSKSLAVINEVLYYKGIHGVYAFTSAPSMISSNFGERRFTNAVAGADGNSYYLSVTDDKGSYLFVFETELGLWILEDKVRAVDFVRDGESFYMLTEDGKFYLCGAKDTDTDMEWSAQFTPFYETIDGAKTYSRILLRVELPKGSYLCVDVRLDGGVWREAGKVVGNSNEVVPVRIPINRCDKFELRLRGKGKCTVLSMMREYFVSSGM